MNDKGFTLIETIVSLLILAMIFVAFSTGISTFSKYYVTSNNVKDTSDTTYDSLETSELTGGTNTNLHISFEDSTSEIEVEYYNKSNEAEKDENQISLSAFKENSKDLADDNQEEQNWENGAKLQKDASKIQASWITCVDYIEGNYFNGDISKVNLNDSRTRNLLNEIHCVKATNKFEFNSTRFAINVGTRGSDFSRVTLSDVDSNLRDGENNYIFTWFDRNENTIYMYSKSGKFKSQNSSLSVEDKYNKSIIKPLQGTPPYDTNYYGLFEGMTNLTNVDFINSVYSIEAESMAEMFAGCERLTNINFSQEHFVFPKKKYSNMFYNCTSLQFVDLSQFKITSSMYINGMFYNCNHLRTTFNVDSVSSKYQNIGYCLYRTANSSGAKITIRSNDDAAFTQLRDTTYDNNSNIEMIKV